MTDSKHSKHSKQCCNKSNANTNIPIITVSPVINIPPIPSPNREQGLLTEFNFAPIVPVDVVQIPQNLTPVPLILHIEDVSDRVLLTVTVQWRGLLAGGASEIDFFIQRRRQGETTFSDVCKFTDTALPFNDPVSGPLNLPIVTSFTCVDTHPISNAGQQEVEYSVRAFRVRGAGGIQQGILVGSEIEANNPINP